MTTLNIQLLGDFRLIYDDAEVPGFHQVRRQSLLAYLIIHRHVPQSRQQIASVFWPDSPEGQARTNLRRELNHLKAHLPNVDEYLTVSRKFVQWKKDASFLLDVAEFERYTEKAAQAASMGQIHDAHNAWEQALQYYRGSLLPDCYDEWVFSVREELNSGYLYVLEQIVVSLENQREFAGAIRLAQRLLQADPLHEATHRRLMRLHALNGDRTTALRTYHICANLLQRELNVEPERETQDAYQRLLKMDTSPAPLPQSDPLRHDSWKLVGRQSDWQVLRRQWRVAQTGNAHLVLIAGEPGVGKTRLAEEFMFSLSQQGIVAARTKSYAAEGTLPYAPVIEWLRTETIRTRFDELDHVWLTELARVLPEILIEHNGLSAPEPMHGRWQRHHLFEAMARAVLASNEPRLLLIDDLQWCDAETLEWLRYLMHVDLGKRLLIVGMVRLEEVLDDHPLPLLLRALHSSNQLTEIQLGRLTPADTADLANQVCGYELEDVIAARIHEITEGNPLYVVEMVRSQMKDRDARFLSEPDAVLSTTERLSPSARPRSPMPPKVQVLIQSRLANLSPQARELASAAATVGRVFRFEVLARVANSDEDSLLSAMDELWRRGIVREQNINDYDFSHDLIREAAYLDIGLARRKVLHRRIAETLESVHRDDLDAISGQIAVHYHRAELYKQAIAFYQRAGVAALQLHASHDAASLLVNGLNLLEQLPETRERAEQELRMQIPLGVALAAVQGIASTGNVYIRARELCRQFRIPTEIAVLRGLASVYMVGGETATAHEICLELLERAQAEREPYYLVEAHYALGALLVWMGKFVTAQQHLEQVIALYESERLRSHPTQYPQDPEAICRIWLALTYWFLGYPDKAARASEESLALVQECDHPLNTAYVWMWYGKLYQLIDNPSVTLEYAERTIEISSRFDFPLWKTQGIVHRSWARAMLGDTESVVEQIHTGMIGHEETGAGAPRPWHLTLLANVYRQLGRVDEGIAVLDEALALAEQSGIYDCQSERFRLKGELLLQSPADDQASWTDAEYCFERAIEVARSQHAKSFELRASLSLACHWQRQGKHTDARNLLANVYAWFTEGFDTPDLQAAKALLDDLA